MKVSVIIPVYNMYKYLRECIESVLRQTISSLEIICIDDGSDDGSYELLLEYEKHNDNIIILRQNRLGPGVARNRGLEVALGDYVCMMDSDDFYPNPFVLELLYNTAQKERVNICGGNIVNYYPDGATIDDERNFKHNGLLDSYEYPLIYGQTRFIYKREFLIANNLRYLPYVRFEDPPFVLESIMMAGRYYVLNEPVYVRRTGYKDPTNNDAYAYGILIGIKMCSQLAMEYDLRELFRNEIRSLVYTNLRYLYRELCRMDSECWEVIRSINSIAYSYDKERLSPFYDYDSFTNYIEGVKQTVLNLNNARKAIIYGAGKMAKEFLELGILDERRIIGFATSDRPMNQEFNGHSLRCIDFFLNESKDYYYIIVAGKDNGDEMEKKLVNSGIDNYLRITGDFLYVVSCTRLFD